MTVANNYAPVVTAANGVTTTFSGPWNAISADNLVVQLLNTTTGVYTPVSQGPGASDYEVTTLTNTGWLITFNNAPAAGNNVIVSRDTPPIQTIPYTTSRGFQGAVEENSFDSLTAMLQENAYTSAHSIQAPIGDTESLVLPIASMRASQYLGFDSSGNVITIAGTASVPVSTAMQPVVEASTLLAGLILLTEGAGGVTAAMLALGTLPPPPYSYIAGCLPSSISGNNTTAALNVSAGLATSSDNTSVLASAGYPWAAANGNAINGTDAPSSILANSTTYHWFLCSGTIGVGTFASASLTPTIPAGYNTKIRRIFSLLTNSSGAIIAITAVEAEGGSYHAYYGSVITDVSAGAVTASGVLFALSVPFGIRCEHKGSFANTSATVGINITSPDEGNIAVGSIFDILAAASAPECLYMTRTTNAASQLRATSGSNISTLSIFTRGFKDWRRV